ncbi:1564_t:CDS:2 [Funneliformis caledonium]|uniref:1564_t:CDS:1 n=1 Tax=Funneliformis caledonium TaxID=1117310 RepID=A0A9N9HT28_9GLOM|nr:1564_t:CDS:2 [Funneliformis caledonium]
MSTRKFKSHERGKSKTRSTKSLELIIYELPDSRKSKSCELPDFRKLKVVNSQILKNWKVLRKSKSCSSSSSPEPRKLKNSKSRSSSSSPKSRKNIKFSLKLDPELEAAIKEKHSRNKYIEIGQKRKIKGDKPEGFNSKFQQCKYKIIWIIQLF